MEALGSIPLPVLIVGAVVAVGLVVLGFIVRKKNTKKD